MCPPGYYQYVISLMVTHTLGHMIYIAVDGLFVSLFEIVYKCIDK